MTVPKIEFRNVNLRYFHPKGRNAGTQGHQLQGRARRVRQHCRPVRLRQEHAAFPAVRADQPDGWRGADRWRSGERPIPAGRLHAAAGQPVRMAHHRRKHHARPGNSRAQPSGIAPSCRGPSETIRSWGLPAQQAVGTFWRHAPARRSGPHNVPAARHPFAGRACWRSIFRRACPSPTRSATSSARKTRLPFW